MIEKVMPVPAQMTAVGVSIVDQTTRIITSGGLENYVILGMTFGAWVKISLFISVIVVILVNIPTAITKWRNLIKDFKNSNKETSYGDTPSTRSHRIPRLGSRRKVETGLYRQPRDYRNDKGEER